MIHLRVMLAVRSSRCNANFAYYYYYTFVAPDGLYCLVLKAPRLLQLFRISDLQEIGIYPCDSDVSCIGITDDSKHLLAGLVDTRLLSFLVVDVQCVSHMGRIEVYCLAAACAF